MLQSTYENLKVYPILVLLGVLLGPYLVLYYSTACCCKSLLAKSPALRNWSELADFVHEKLAALSFKILFSQEKIKVENARLSAYVTKTLQKVFSLLPLLLICMAGTVFWNNFLTQQTDNCNTQDLDLECFSDLIGPLTCSEVIENYSTYICYKFSFDVVNAGAAAGGIFTASVVFCVILVKFFVCVRYTFANRSVTAIVQLITALAIIAGFSYLLLLPIYSGKPEEFIQVLAIYLCSAFCCMYPWYSIEPQPSSDKLQRICLPCLCQYKRSEYEIIRNDLEEAA